MAKRDRDAIRFRIGLLALVGAEGGTRTRPSFCLVLHYFAVFLRKCGIVAYASPALSALPALRCPLVVPQH
jgi:hypothetical protein